METVCKEYEATGNEEFFEDGDDCHNERCEGYNEHEAHWTIEHPAFFTGRFEKYRKCDQDEGGEELVGCAEERPYVHVSAEAEKIAEEECDDRGEAGIRQDSLKRRHRSWIGAVAHEQFLEGHTTDTSNRVKRGQGEC